MIEPEAVPPASRPRRRAVLAGVTLLAVVAVVTGGLAVAGDGPGRKAQPLALMAGNGPAGGAEKTVAPATPALGASADNQSFAPYPAGGWGLKFQVDGDLPALPDHAAAWTVSGPAFDRAAVARIVGALGVTGAPVRRDGGWFVDDGDWVLAANPGGDTWSISYYRSRFGAMADDAAAGATAAGQAGAPGPALSRADAERRVQDLIDRMGAPGGSWKIETTETEIGVGWTCAAPARMTTDGELTKLEADKLRQLQTPTAGNSTPNAAAQPNTGSTGSGAASAGSTTATPPDAVGAPTPADKPAPDGVVAPCPAPPAPVKGFNVALYPLLDGRRADWPLWNVTLRSDGRVENLSGSWATFERGGDYKLRGVDAALKELTTPPEPPTVITEGVTVEGVTADPAASDPIGPNATVSNGALIGPTPPKPAAAKPAGTPSTPDIAPAITPVCTPVPMPMPMPMPAEKTRPLPAEKATAQPAGAATSSFAPACVTPTPQVVTITGVELGLIQAPVFEGGHVRLHLVPSYRFLGHFDNGTPWETSVIALHPDAIAPRPNFPIADDLRGTGGGSGTGKVIPPTPATPEPGTDTAPAAAGGH